MTISIISLQPPFFSVPKSRKNAGNFPHFHATLPLYTQRESQYENVLERAALNFLKFSLSKLHAHENPCCELIPQPI